jgi:hypothetical protein
VGTGTGTGVGTGTGTGVGEGRGSGHDFRVAPAACAPCHPTPPAPSDLRQRAARLWSVLGAAAAPPARAGTATPAHAGGARADRRTVAGRAAWNVLLVLEDPAAAAHNAPYARLLLDSAERAMATTAGRSR